MVREHDSRAEEPLVSKLAFALSCIAGNVKDIRELLSSRISLYKLEGLQEVVELLVKLEAVVLQKPINK